MRRGDFYQIQNYAMEYLYLDWNIFDKIEKFITNELSNNEIPNYSKLFNLISSDSFILPYSNAHMNDLIRGYQNNPRFTSGHLSILSTLTNNLCIVQYWGYEDIKWHYRDIVEFFFSTLDEYNSTPQSLSELIKIDETGEIKKNLDLYKKQKIPKEFKNIYKIDPMFNLIYPRTKIKMNGYSLCEDMYNLFVNSRKDYSLYKSIIKFLNTIYNDNAYIKNISDQFNIPIDLLPTHLELKKIIDAHLPNAKTSDNKICQLVTDTYFTINLEGKHSDTKLNNLVDDALHVFYASYCDYFITLDKKCKFKAEKVYNKLNISTKIFTPSEFINFI